MKKNFLKKKLVSGLALALVIASLAPAGFSASAATATKIVKKGGAAAPTVLYVGDKGTDYNLSNEYKTNTYNWKISNSKLATINAKTGVVTPKAPGTVTIRVTARNAKTNKWLKDFTQKVYIKQRVESVDIASEDFTLGTGEVKDLNAVKNPKTSTDVLVYASNDEKVATVDAKTGVVTGVAPGEATITVYAKGLASSPITSKYNRTDSVKVTVAVGITAVKQTTTNKLQLTFNADVAKTLTVKDLAISNAVTNANQAIKAVSFSEDGKTVTVETYLNYTDAAEYKVVFAEKAISFKASVGKVAAIKLLTNTVDFATATEIKYALYDANGVDVTAVSEAYRVVLDVDTTQGYTEAGNKLTLFAVGNTAKVKATYHTYEYVDNKEVTFSDEVVITAVDPKVTTVGNYEKFTVTKDATPDWTKAANTTLAVYDSGYKIFVKAKDSNGNDVALSSITYESSNKDYLIVSSTGVLTPVKEGTVYVIASVGKTSWTLPVTVTAKREASTINVEDNKLSVTISNTTQITDFADVKAIVKDQYGSDMGLTGVTVAPANVNDTRVYPVATASGASVKFESTAALLKGSYTFILTLGGKTIPVTVNVVQPDATLVSTYQLIQNTTTVDTVIKSTTVASDKDVTFRVGEYKGGVLYDYASITSISITNSNGAEVANTATFSAITVSGGAVTKVATGTYKATVVAAGKTLYGHITVTDTQAGATFALDQLTSSTTGTTIRTAIDECFTIKDANGVVITLGNIASVTYRSTATIANIDTAVASGTSVFIEKVVVNTSVGGFTVPVELTIGRSVTIK